MSVNKVILLGNVCQQPRVASFEGGGKSASLTLATNKRPFRTRDGRDMPGRTEYHNVAVGLTGLADVVERYVHRGDRLYVEGELRTRQYKDQNQMVHYVTEVWAEKIELLTPPRPTGDEPNGPAAANGAHEHPSRQSSAPSAPFPPAGAAWP